MGLIFLESGETAPDRVFVVRAAMDGMPTQGSLPVVAWLPEGMTPEAAFVEFTSLHPTCGRVEVGHSSPGGALCWSGLRIPGHSPLVQVRWSSNFTRGYPHGVSINGKLWEFLNDREGLGYQDRPTWKVSDGKGWHDPWETTFPMFASGSSCLALKALTEEYVVEILLEATTNLVVM